jgi:hypothetical protein
MAADDLRCTRKTSHVRTLLPATLEHFEPGLALLPGDLALATLEEDFAGAWCHGLTRDERVFERFCQCVRERGKATPARRRYPNPTAKGPESSGIPGPILCSLSRGTIRR